MIPVLPQECLHLCVDRVDPESTYGRKKSTDEIGNLRQLHVRPAMRVPDQY
ncbi:hypothetical protein [Kribbella sp. NPDC004875]|uniref:hypothetical protein n=1 Tax=Kribbella sp. NPDC004875 TaxID=3364107 RepID=UPI003698F044